MPYVPRANVATAAIVIESMSISQKIRLVLLDRDGVINHDSENYITSADQWRPIPGSMDAVRRLQARFQVAVCTNQAGIGRGLMTQDALDTIHDMLQAALQRAGAEAIPIYHCPHHPDDGCDCRKPEPGLLISAMRAADVGDHETCFVGDSLRDVQAALNAGCAPILVRTGNGRAVEDAEVESLTNVSVYDDLAACATALLEGP